MKSKIHITKHLSQPFTRNNKSIGIYNIHEKEEKKKLN
jgi:hypothetical protein